MQDDKPSSSKLVTGFSGFTIVWLGQIVSVLATNMSHFALSIWMFQITRSATAMGINEVAFLIPYMALSPLAGMMVDRYNRKLMMMMSDLLSVLATIGILILQLTGHLEFWHLYFASFLQGVGNTFQWPAYSASISLMLPKQHYGRANGMMSLVDSGPGVVSPLLAGALLPVIGLSGILSIDILTFVFAIGALLLVFIPQPKRAAEVLKEKAGFFKEITFGFRFIRSRKSLLNLLTIFLLGNFFSGIGWAVFAPMILARTGNSSVTLGIVESVAAVGGVVGGVIMSVWGGFKRRIHGILIGWIVSSMIGMVFFGLGRDLAVWLPTVVIASMGVPIINGSSQAIWQSKVAPDVQGRVFSARRFIAMIADPISPIVGGVMADFLLEPGMRSETGFLAPLFAPLVGTGPGAGMSLLFIFGGLIAALVAGMGYLIPAIRNVEDILPDHDQTAAIA